MNTKRDLPVPRAYGQRSATSHTSKGPFSRLVNVRDVPKDGLTTTIAATPAECTAIAADAAIPAVHALSASFDIAARAGGRYLVTGSLTATITELCVVSLEPFDCDVAHEIDLTFAPVAGAPAPAASGRRHRDGAADAKASSHRPPPPVPGSDDQIDPPDPIIDDRIDVGAVAVEFLILARDLYPKKPGVAFDDVVAAADEAEPSPFAALAHLKDGQ